MSSKDPVCGEDGTGKIEQPAYPLCPSAVNETYYCVRTSVTSTTPQGSPTAIKGASARPTTSVEGESAKVVRGAILFF